MGLALIRTTASPASGSTYTPNALLSDFFVLTLPTGSIGIAPAVNVGAGQFVAIKLIYPSGSVTVTWDPAYLLAGDGSGTYQSSAANAMTFGFFYEGGFFQKVWVAPS